MEIEDENIPNPSARKVHFGGRMTHCCYCFPLQTGLTWLGFGYTISFVLYAALFMLVYNMNQQIQNGIPMINSLGGATQDVNATTLLPMKYLGDNLLKSAQLQQENVSLSQSSLPLKSEKVQESPAVTPTTPKVSESTNSTDTKSVSTNKKTVVSKEKIAISFTQGTQTGMTNVDGMQQSGTSPHNFDLEDVIPDSQSQAIRPEQLRLIPGFLEINEDTYLTELRQILLIQCVCMLSYVIFFWFSLYYDSTTTRKLLVFGMILATVAYNLNWASFKIDNHALVGFTNLLSLYYVYCAWVYSNQEIQQKYQYSEFL